MSRTQSYKKYSGTKSLLGFIGDLQRASKDLTDDYVHDDLVRITKRYNAFDESKSKYADYVASVSYQSMHRQWRLSNLRNKRKKVLEQYKYKIIEDFKRTDEIILIRNFLEEIMAKAAKDDYIDDRLHKLGLYLLDENCPHKFNEQISRSYSYKLKDKLVNALRLFIN